MISTKVLAEGQPHWDKQLMKIISANILIYMKLMEIISTNILMHMKSYIQKRFGIK